MITGLVCERIPRAYGLDAMRDVQVLSPMHKGEAGTQALNEALRERLQSHRAGSGPGTGAVPPGRPGAPDQKRL
jgi:hypothetical protein